MHNPSINQVQIEHYTRTFVELQKEGLIKHWGVSLHDPEVGVLAIKTMKPETIQVVYNVFNQAAAEELFDVAKQEGVGIIAREPLANGFLTGKYDEASTFRPGDIRHDIMGKEHIVMYARLSRRVRELLAERKDSWRNSLSGSCCTTTPSPSRFLEPRLLDR